MAKDLGGSGTFWLQVSGECLHGATPCRPLNVVGGAIHRQPGKVKRLGIDRAVYRVGELQAKGCGVHVGRRRPYYSWVLAFGE